MTDNNREDSSSGSSHFHDAPKKHAVSETASETTATSDEGPADGELGVLLNSLEEDEVPGALARNLSGMMSSQTGEAIYGQPLSVEKAKDRMPPGGGGISYHATIVPDDFFVDGKLRRGLTRRDFDLEKQAIKPRRPSLPVTFHDFFSSITAIAGPQGARYIFYGVLNGWPSLRCFEVVGVEQRRHSGPMPSFISGQILWNSIWKADAEGAEGIEPKPTDKNKIYRVKLRGAPWSSQGWSKESPGFAFWFEAQRPEGPRLVYGTDMTKMLGGEKCTYVHNISHRYAVVRESPRDRLTYHSIVLLEWEHGQYMTVVEAAYLNGIGGYKGKSNWYDDKDDGSPALYRVLPPEMICPWKTTAAELRGYDVKAKNLDEFKEYIARYQGSTKRFVDPHFTFSHPARLTFRSKSQIAQVSHYAGYLYQ